MKTLRRIDTEGNYGDITITGSNRNTEIGLHIHVPEGEEISVGKVNISNVFLPILKTGLGVFKFESITTSEFGGDNFNIRANGNAQGSSLIIESHTPTRPYNRCVRVGDETIEECLARNGETVYDASLLQFEEWPKDSGREVILGYHADAILQVYSTPEIGYPAYSDKLRDPQGGYGEISNVFIPNIRANLTGATTQAIMGSERCKYSHIYLGTESLVINSDGYPYHTVFNSLENSVIGCTDNVIRPGCKVKVVNAKDSPHLNRNNQYIGFTSEDVIGDVVMTDNPRMKTIEVPVFTQIPSDLSIKSFAQENNVEAAKLEAFVVVESKGESHLKGRVLKLQEPHVLWRALNRQGIDPRVVLEEVPEMKKVLQRRPRKRGTYGSSASQNDKFDLACTISISAAIESCSWGFAQVLGENWEMCGFYSPEDFRNGVQTKQGQLYAFLNYLKNRKGLLAALRLGDWDRVADLYNGPNDYDGDGNGINDYTEKLMKAYTRRVLRQAPNRTQSNSFKKSRTKKKEAASIGSKVAVAVTTGGAAYYTEAIEGLNTAKEVISKGKDTIVKTGTEAHGVLDSIGASLNLSTVLYFIVGVAVTSIYFSYKNMKHYDEDNGFSKVKGILDDLMD